MFKETRTRRCFKVKKNYKPFCISLGEVELAKLRKYAYNKNVSVASIIKVLLNKMWQENKEEKLCH